MKNPVTTCFGILVAVVAASPNCWAADVNFLAGDGNFTTPASWSDNAVPSDDGDIYFIQDSLTSTFSGGIHSVTKLVVSDGSPGTLNITGGQLTVAGLGNDTFAIGRGCCGADGLVDVSGTAILRTGSADSSFVGQRDKGVLHIGPNAQVIGTDVWRVGQFGPVIDAGLEGNGFIDVEGSFSARLMFLGVDDGTGRLRVRGNGSVVLTDNLQPGVNTGFPTRSALIEMIGSDAFLSARALESANGAAEVKNQYLFDADAGGVSPITLTVAVNIDNNKVTVDLTDYALAAGTSIKLFDAPLPGEFPTVYGTIAELSVLGGVSPSNYYVTYDYANGDILLTRTVPEPSTMLLLGLGLSLAMIAKRRAHR